MPVYAYKIKRKNTMHTEIDEKGNYTWFYYEGKYKKVNGEHAAYKKKGFATEELAKTAEEEILTKIKNRSGGNLILNELWVEYYEYSLLNKEKSTCSDDLYKYSKHIDPYFGNRFIKDITPRDIIGWQTHLSNEYEQVTVANIHKVFNKILVFADKLYDTKWIPTAKVGRPRKKEKAKEFQFWTEQEFKIFYNTIDDLEHKALFMIFFFCGLRRGELLALKWNDLFNNFIRIDESCANIDGRQVIKSPKNLNSKRLVELDNKTKQILDSLLMLRAVEKGFSMNHFIFGRKTKPLAFESLRKIKLKYEKESGVKHITIHALRHSHVTMLINNSMPIPAIAARIGDSINEVLKTYAHILPSSNLEIKLYLDKVTESYTVV